MSVFLYVLYLSRHSDVMGCPAGSERGAAKLQDQHQVTHAESLLVLGKGVFGLPDCLAELLGIVCEAEGRPRGFFFYACERYFCAVVIAGRVTGTLPK